MTDVLPSESDSGARLFDRSFRPVFPDGDEAGIPGHMGPIKKLHSRTGFNLGITRLEEGTLKVRGILEKPEPNPDGDDVLKLTSDEVGEVRIMGLKTKHYVAMNEEGDVYAEPDGSSEATVFYEDMHNGWNVYKSKLNEDRGWYLGIKKSGKAKKGPRTAFGQKATLFIPRPVQRFTQPS